MGDLGRWEQGVLSRRGREGLDRLVAEALVNLVELNQFSLFRRQSSVGRNCCAETNWF